MGIEQQGKSRGVPQGYVLGSTLWNLGYNMVLEVAVSGGLQVICYTDDTLRLTETAVAAITMKILELELEIAT